jgi:hypothetical protein
MSKIIKDLELDELSLVDRPAHPKAKAVLFKGLRSFLVKVFRGDPEEPVEELQLSPETLALAKAVEEGQDPESLVAEYRQELEKRRQVDDAEDQADGGVDEDEEDQPVEKPVKKGGGKCPECGAIMKGDGTYGCSHMKKSLTEDEDPMDNALEKALHRAERLEAQLRKAGITPSDETPAELETLTKGLDGPAREAVVKLFQDNQAKEARLASLEKAALNREQLAKAEKLVGETNVTPAEAVTLLKQLDEEGTKVFAGIMRKFNGAMEVAGLDGAELGSSTEDPAPVRKGEALAQAVTKYLEQHKDADETEAVVKVLEENPELYEEPAGYARA